MTKQEEKELLVALDAKSMSVMISKGEDYATVDVLSNFKRLSGIVSQMGMSLDTPTGYALFMVLMKIDRINNLVSESKTPNNESLEDSFMDGINYFKLAYLCYIESKKNNVKSENKSTVGVI